MLNNPFNKTILKLIKQKKIGINLTKDDFSFFVNKLKTKQITRDEFILFLSTLDYCSLSVSETIDFISTLLQLSKETSKKNEINLSNKTIKYTAFTKLPDSNHFVLASLFSAFNINFFCEGYNNYNFFQSIFDNAKIIDLKTDKLSVNKQNNVLSVSNILFLNNHTLLNEALIKMLDAFCMLDLFTNPLVFFAVYFASELKSNNMVYLWSISVGKNGFFETIQQAKRFQSLMFEVANHFNVQLIIAFVSADKLLDLDYGLALCIKKNMDLLNGSFKYDQLKKDLIKIVSEVLYLTNWEINKEKVQKRCEELLTNKEGLIKVYRYVSLQKGMDLVKFNNFRLKKYFSYKNKQEVIAQKDGLFNLSSEASLIDWLKELNLAKTINNDKLDPMAGISFNKNLNEEVKKNDVLLTIYSNNKIAKELVKNIEKCISIKDVKENAWTTYIKSIETNKNLIKVKKND